MSKLMHQQNSKLESTGFTLVELMVTVAIMAIIAGFTFGNLNSTSYHLKSTAKTLKANMQKARLLAVKENCRVYVDFDFNGDGTVDSSYTLWKDLSDNGGYNDATTDNNGDGAVNALDEELIETIPLPNRVSFGAVTNANGGPANSPSGGANPAATIISYTGDIVSFSSQGTSGSGWAYLHSPANDEAGSHAVGTNNIGRVRSSYYATEGGSWN
jgi:prepilin-type N-terminal cleavage/methylation domain-containing protein